MNNELIAKKVWERLYPERHGWDKLTKNTQDEWVRFIDISQEEVLEDYLSNALALESLLERVSIR